MNRQQALLLAVNAVADLLEQSGSAIDDLLSQSGDDLPDEIRSAIIPLKTAIEMLPLYLLTHPVEDRLAEHDFARGAVEPIDHPSTSTHLISGKDCHAVQGSRQPRP